MKKTCSSPGRRQFLSGACAASASALVFKKLAKSFDPGVRTEAGTVAGKRMNVAQASETSGAAGVKGVFSDRYYHLLSPLKIGNVVLKNRLMSCNAMPHFLQGPENFPAEPIRNYFVNLARNGAGVVIPRILSNRVRKELGGDSAHMVIYDLEDAGVQNYLDQMVEAVHCYDTKVCRSIRITAPGAGSGMPGPGGPVDPDEATLGKMIEDTVKEATFYWNHGFDMVNLRQSFITKNRKDQYGGASIKNRARFAVELCREVKKACGRDFLIWMPLTVIEPWINLPSNEDLYHEGEVKDIVALAKELAGWVDILEIRDAGANTAFTFEKSELPLAVRVTRAIKESGAKIIVAPNGGVRDPELSNAFVADGKTDLISMGRAFICDWEYGKKIHEGRGEDTAPCIMCNKCHGTSMNGEWYTVCSVNAKIAIEPAVRAIEAPSVKRTVAVIGGGPAGMKAALVAAERGHRVTLYEKGDSLGGLLRHADFPSFKWTLRDYKDYLVRQVNKGGIAVHLNTDATPEMIRAKGFDVVIAAVGASPVIPSLPGMDGENVWNVENVYGNEKFLGKNVVVIGGGETGAETGMYLAESGHRVTVLTSEKELVKVNRVHYPTEIIDAYKRMDNFHSITEAVATGISKGKVTYSDKAGNGKSVAADSVVLYAGFRARQDEALAFYGAGKRFFAVGECGGAGFGVQKAIRNAFFTASQV